MKSKVLQENLKCCANECAMKKGKSASAVSGTLCTNERTNERMSPEQTQSEPISHPSAMPTAPEPPSPTAMVSIFARQIWLFDSGGHTPQSHTSEPTTDLEIERGLPILSPIDPAPCSRFQFPWHTYSCHIKSVGWDQSSMGFRKFQGAALHRGYQFLEMQ